MALFTKKEFADNCRIETKMLSVYITRRKVIVQNDMVDDSNPINVLFLQKCLLKPPKEKLEVAKTEVSGKPMKSKKAQKAQISEKKSEASKKADESFDLDTEKKRMQIENLRREARMKDVQEEKAIGRLLPSDAIKSLFIQTLKAYTMSFKQAADKIILEFGKRNKMNRNDLAEMRGELIVAINKASDEGIAESKKGVQNIMREYSENKK